MVATLEPSTVFYSFERPVAHLPSVLPQRGLCGAPIRNVEPLGEYVRCADCEGIMRRRSGQ